MATTKQTKKSAASDEITLPKIDKRTIEVRIKGVSPLIVHAWSEKAKRQMREKQMKQARMQKEAKDPQADFEGSKYLNDAGRDCIPAAALRNAIISAGRFTDGVPMTRICGSVFFLDDMIEIKYDECRNREDMVRVGGKGPGTGTADLRYRAEYTGWSIALKIEFNANVLSVEQLLNLIQTAGFAVGLCEWRPEKRGQFGRFDIDGGAREIKQAA